MSVEEMVFLTNTAKNVLRSSIREALKLIPNDRLQQQSDLIAKKVFSLPAIVAAKGIGIYLPKPSSELRTLEIAIQLLVAGKTLYIPKVYGSNAPDMTMWRISLSECQDIEGNDNFEKARSILTSLPLNVWKIAEPSLEAVLSQQQVDSIAQLHPIPSGGPPLEVLLMPGVGFDHHGGRLGHGKGYYDCFVNHLCSDLTATDLQPPLLVGLGLDEQVLPPNVRVPLEAHDRRLDALLTPSHTLMFDISS